MYTWQIEKSKNKNWVKKKVKPNGKTKRRWEVLQRDDFTCQYCGRSPQANTGVVLHADHINPKSNGGLDEKSNLITACEDCNQGKGNAYFGEAFTEKFKQFISQKTLS